MDTRRSDASIQNYGFTRFGIRVCSIGLYLPQEFDISICQNFIAFEESY